MGLTPQFSMDSIRVLAYPYSYSTERVELSAEYYLDKAVKQVRQLGTTLLLETKDSNGEFPRDTQILIKIVKFDHQRVAFDEPDFLYIEKTDTLLDLKKLLAEKFDIPVEKQVIESFHHLHFKRIIKPVYWNEPKILENNDTVMKDEIRLFDGNTFYLEYCEDPKSESPAAQELDRLKNLIEVKHNLLGSEESDQTLHVSKKITFGEFKKILQPIVKLELDEFRVYRIWPHSGSKTELRNENSTLSHIGITDGTKFFIEKGRPIKEGEAHLSFFEYSLGLHSSFHYSQCRESKQRF